MTWNIIVPDRLAPPADVEQAVFGDLGIVTTLEARGASDLRGRIEEADAILAWHDLVWDAALLATLSRCKTIVRVGVGFDNVDRRAANQLGIVVCNVPDYGTHDVADHAIALLLALARGLGPYDRVARAGAWSWGLAPSFRLTGKLLGIVGLGRIGTATALRAKALGMRVGFYDPYKPSGWDKSLQLTRFAGLDELVGEADVISLHTPLTDETRGMVDSRLLSRAKRGVVVINTARGPIIDWTAFSSAFASGQIGCAGLDVLPTEPADASDPLIAAWMTGEPSVRDRLLITPHCAFYSIEALHEMRRKAAEEALRVLSGMPPWNPV